jgi:hypothetical protein
VRTMAREYHPLILMPTAAPLSATRPRERLSVGAAVLWIGALSLVGWAIIVSVALISMAVGVPQAAEGLKTCEGLLDAYAQQVFDARLNR